MSSNGVPNVTEAEAKLPLAVESSKSAPAPENPTAWADIAEQTWTRFTDAVTENPWAAAGTAAAIGLAGAGLYLRFKGYGYKQMVATSLMNEARALAEKMLGLSQRSLRAMKRALNQVAIIDIEKSLALETDITVESFLDPDTTARIAAFSKK